jgi:hypothetical protein
MVGVYPAATGCARTRLAPLLQGMEVLLEGLRGSGLWPRSRRRGVSDNPQGPFAADDRS